MGNQLSGIVPQNIHPVEYYINDISNTELISYDANLGSTRFFKVAKVKLHSVRPQLTAINTSSSINNYNGFGPPSFGVAKVFVINDPSLPLKLHKDRILQLKDALKENANALPFERVIVSEKAAICLRQFVKYSLDERLSTRPFFTFFEKKWVCFQILKCVQWMHKRGFCHGDVKSENILVTSSLWILLTDFASYKPVFLPEDNPADFSFFFDTSRKRTCNVAPERFVSPEVLQAGDSLPGGNSGAASISSGLTPQMDLFSLGCVFAELFSEDSSNNRLFDFSVLLQYRSKGRQCEGPMKTINSIPNEQIREMILNLIELDPGLRCSTSQHLLELTPSLFPSYFSSLFEYIQQLLKLSPDGKVVKLAADIDQLVKVIVIEDSQGLVVLLFLVLSSLRSLKHVHAKITALKLFSDLINADKTAMSIHILDRILPYLLNVLKVEKSSTVRTEALYTLEMALNCVVDVPSSNNNVFPDYILKSLDEIVSDKSVLVRIALASTVSNLAQIALRFLHSSCQDQNYHTELSTLQDDFQKIVSNLLTDSDNAVKRALLSSNIAKLCTFFGRQKTSDIILSHLVTFLNDKESFELRCSFFDSIVPIAAYLGAQSSPILKPLLQQGITDSEETVISKTLCSLSELTRLNLLNRTVLFELTMDALPLLSHPNLWIRHSLVSFILTLGAQLTLAELNCKLMPLLKPYLKREIHCIKSNALLLDSLENSVPRNIYDMVVNKSIPSNSIEQFYEYIIKRRMIKSATKHRSASPPNLDSSASSPAALFDKLKSEGLTDAVEEKFLKMSDVIKRVNRSLKSLNAPLTNEKQRCIMVARKNRKLGNLQLSDQVQFHSDSRGRSKQLVSSNMNEEWLQMFGSDSQKASSDSAGEDTERSQDSDIVYEEAFVIPVAHEARESMEDRSVIECPPCVNDFNSLVEHRRDYFMDLVASSNTISVLGSTGKFVSSSYRPKGILVAHLHEHSGSVNRLISINDTTLFVSCSSDSSIKIWDSSKMEEGKSIINRSKQTFVSSELSPAEGITYCSAFDTLVMYSSSSSLYVLQIEGKPSRMKFLRKFANFGKEKVDSCITDISSLSPHTFMVSTSDSRINAFDLRQSLHSPVLALSLIPSEGLITSISGCEYSIFCGTSGGVIVTFDTRFRLRANTMSYPTLSTPYPTKQRVRRILYNGQCLYSSVKGNNEVTQWDCGTGTRQKTLWASSAPALSRNLSQTTPDSVFAMVSLTSRDTNSLITCGTDMKIRYWDLMIPCKSYVINDQWKTPPSPSTGPHAPYVIPPKVASYSSNIIEGIQVIQERYERQHHNHQACEQLTVSASHRDIITDLTWVQKNNILVSGSRDGVVKLWR